jgi:peptidoglycan/xylan/chitin deacetylase (PgdA/CDA1 family)
MTRPSPPWSLGALLLVLLLLDAVRAAAAESLQPPPLPAGIILEAGDAATVRLTWEPSPGVSYRLCVTHDRARRQPRACFPAGHGETVAGIPPGDGEQYLFALQACWNGSGECSALVDAGAAGRRLGGGFDFYATAVLLPDGQALLSGFSLRPGATISYHQARPGRPEQQRFSCPAVGEAVCGSAVLRLPGALAGVSQELPAGGSVGITFQLRERPRAALLFDDGTGHFTGQRLTAQLILDEFGVKGTFFLVGRVMRDYPGAVRALVSAGHRVGNHTYSHPFLTRLTDVQIGQELDLTEQQYRQVIPGGTTRPCFRAPNGAIDRRVAAIAAARGYRQVDWTVSSVDWSGISADRVTRNVLDHAHDGVLISFHTQEQATLAALRTIVGTMLAWGYIFEVAC